VFVIHVPVGESYWLLTWPNGSPRRFRTREAAERCRVRLPVRTCAGAYVVPATRAR